MVLERASERVFVVVDINILAANVSYLNDKPTLSGKKQIDEWYAYVKRVKDLEKSIH